MDVLVKNTGTETWPAAATSTSDHAVHMSYVWLDQSGAVTLVGGRSIFPEPMQPGDICEIHLDINAPNLPGHYKLMISPVQEGIKWFYPELPANASPAKNVEIYRPLGGEIAHRIFHF